LWPKPREPKWTPTQTRPVVVLHEIQIVVTRADGAKLRTCGLQELPLRCEVCVTNPIEDRMVAALLGGNAHAERDSSRDLAHDEHDSAQRVEIGARQLRAHRLVAGPDVVADAGRRDVTLVRDAAADRLAAARVVVGAEDAEVRVARGHAALELLEAAPVHGAEGLDRARRHAGSAAANAS
jgi:hypothetical protein